MVNGTMLLSLILSKSRSKYGTFINYRHLSVEYVQIDPIDIEGFNRLSMIRFDRILFVNQATRGQWLTTAFYPMAMA